VDDLLVWLRQQLDEDEQVALAASPGPWSPNAESYEVVAVDGITVADGIALSGPQLRATVEHIALHDPARVLREVEAKRRIVNSFAAGIEAQPLERGTERYALTRFVLRLLALPYSDRPGFREEWKP
jgi:hypothetical protein